MGGTLENREPTVAVQQSPRTWEGSGRGQGRHDLCGRGHGGLGAGNPERKLGLVTARPMGDTCLKGGRLGLRRSPGRDPRVCGVSVA